MVNEIINGISLKLNQVFGDGVEIYGDTDIVQGLAEPCFFIALLNPSQTKMVGHRYFRENPFNVQYFPRNAEDNIELHDVASELFEVLEYITLPNGDVLHGTAMSYDIVGGVLHFRVNYNLYIMRNITPEEPMTEIESNIIPKG